MEKKLKITLIVTVYNEEETIKRLLDAVKKQTRLPDEMVIVDADSNDYTVSLIQKHALQKSIPITVLVQKGNRSVGRNTAIQKAKYDWIAITDAGCIPRPYWLEAIEQCQLKTNAMVIAGNQLGKPSNSFEEAVIPYVLVMQDKIKDGSYLPATRSVLLKKKVWLEVEKFNEKLSLNEDFAFFKKIQTRKYKIAICKKAIIEWLPRKNVLEFFKMITAFATGDAQAGIYRPKVYFLFFRYFLGITILCLLFSLHTVVASYFLFIVASGYTFWSIQKNITYAPTGWYWLPVLQVLADVGVMYGTLKGTFQKT